MPQFADLEIRVGAETANGFPVEFELDHERQFVGGYLIPEHKPDLRNATAEEAGKRLFAWLVADPVLRSAWDTVHGAHDNIRVRMRIDADAPMLHALPWEALRVGLSTGSVSVLAADAKTPFSRYLSVAHHPGDAVSLPLRVLVAIAAPDNLADLGLAEIDQELEWLALQHAVDNMDVELMRLSQPCTLTNLEKAIRAGCHVLHFVGHGLWNDDSRTASLVLADDENRAVVVDDTKIVAMIDRLPSASKTTQRLRLVFLASCLTAKRSGADAFRGIAPKLVGARVPAVIGMQDLVPVETVRAFSRVFYQRLLAHGLVDLAANEARSILLTAQLPGAAIPVLFMRLTDGILWQVPEEEEAQFSINRRRVVIGSLVLPTWILSVMTLLVLVAFCAVGYAIYEVAYLDPPPKMTGDFNIAVADFGVQAEDGSIQPHDFGAKLSQSVFNELARNLQRLNSSQSFDQTVQIQHDSEDRPHQTRSMGIVRGNTEEARNKSAEQLAELVGAHMVIYGYLTDDEDPEGLVLEFFYTSPNLTLKPDTLNGSHRLGLAIPASLEVFDIDPTAAQLSAQPQIAERTRAIFWITLGLVQGVMNNRHDAAVETFRVAEEELGDWQDKDGKEVLYLFMGQNALVARQHDEAERAFLRARAINSKNARSIAGLASVKTDRAQLYFVRNVDLPDNIAHCVDSSGLAYAATSLKEAQSLLETSLALYNEALELASGSDEPLLTPALQLHQSSAYLSLSTAAQAAENPDAALDALENMHHLLSASRSAMEKFGRDRYVAWADTLNGLAYFRKGNVLEGKVAHAINAQQDESAQSLQTAATASFESARQYLQQCIDMREVDALKADFFYQKFLLGCACEPYLEQIDQVLETVGSQ